MDRRAFETGDISREAFFALTDMCEFVKRLLMCVGVVVHTLQKGEDCLMIPSLGGLHGVKK